MDEFPSRPYAPIDKKSHAIEVPQGFYGLANKPHKNIQFMTTAVANCVALGLVGYNDDSIAPLVSLSHLDTPYLVEESLRLLFDGMRQAARVEDISVYIVNGASHHKLLNPIREFCNRLNLEKCQIATFESQIASLTIDLRNGQARAVNDYCPLPTYIPDQHAKNVCFNYLFTRKTRPGNPIWADMPGYPMAEIFHVSRGVPPFYELKKDNAPADMQGKAPLPINSL